MRTSSESDLEPPVTMIHGYASEQCLRKTLTRIKIQQQEELEAQKAKAALEAAQNSEEDAEDDAEDEMKMSESKADISTFQEDMDSIADFLVNDATLFTTKLL